MDPFSLIGIGTNLFFVIRMLRDNGDREDISPSDTASHSTTGQKARREVEEECATVSLSQTERDEVADVLRKSAR